MRDHRKLDAWVLADELALALYKTTRTWPSEERFGLTSQVRRASVSIVSNLVEGSARSTQREYLRYIEVAFSSAREVLYQLSLARRLEFQVDDLETKADKICRALSGLLRSMETGS